MFDVEEDDLIADFFKIVVGEDIFFYSLAGFAPGGGKKCQDWFLFFLGQSSDLFQSVLFRQPLAFTQFNLFFPGGQAQGNTDKQKK